MNRFKHVMELIMFILRPHGGFGRLPEDIETPMARCVKTFQGR